MSTNRCICCGRDLPTVDCPSNTCYTCTARCTWSTCRVSPRLTTLVSPTSLDDWPTVRLGALLADKVARQIDGTYVHETTTRQVWSPPFKRAWEFVPTNGGPILTIYCTRKWVEVSIRDTEYGALHTALMAATSERDTETLEALAIATRFIQRNLR